MSDIGATPRSGETATEAGGATAGTADLAARVAARICHDLVSPVGAIANGIDLIAEIGGTGADEELALVRRSSERAATLLRVQRLAFGPAGADGQPVSRTRLAADLGEAIGGRRVALHVEGVEGPALSAPAARLVALMVLSARSLLGLSGGISVTLDAGADLPVTVAAEGEKAAVGEAQAAWIAGDGSAGLPEAREVELALVGAAAEGAGARLALTHAPGRVALAAMPT